MELKAANDRGGRGVGEKICRKNIKRMASWNFVVGREHKE